MWVLYAFGSAVFAGLTAILSKYGIRHTDSNVATAVRTVVVLIFAWIMVFITGDLGGVTAVDGRTVLFLVLSGLATGASWLCYFRALQLGDVNKVTPIDKSSTVLTMLLAFAFLGEIPADPAMMVCNVFSMVLIGTGTILMIQKKPDGKKTETGKEPEDGGNIQIGREPQPGGRKWLIYACLSAVFASLTSILGKIGIEGIPSNLGTAIRTAVVLVMAWIVVFVTGKRQEVKQIDGKSWIFLILSGFATGGSWLCYYRALQDGLASVVVPVDKLSILPTILFSQVFLKEKLSKKAAVGLAMIVAGTLLLLVKL